MPGRGVALKAPFSLQRGVAGAEFFIALEAFYRHLRDTGYARECRSLRRLPLAGFGESLPAFAYQVTIDFQDARTEAACYGYIQGNQEPVRSLHLAMNSRVAEGALFYPTTPR